MDIVRSTVQCFECFCDENMIGIITNSTNTYTDTMKNRYARDRDERNTDTLETAAFIVIPYIAGVLKSGRLNVEDL